MPANARSIVLFVVTAPPLAVYTVAGAALAIVALPITIPLGVIMALRGLNAIVEEIANEHESEEEVSGLAVIFGLAVLPAFLVYVPMAPIVHLLSLWGRAVERLRNV